MMDILPIKFRSPPPKPPRRRHSDQISISSTGTLPSTKRKDFEISHISNNQTPQDTENSISSCGSLPSNWTPDFSLEENIEKVPAFKQNDSSNNHAKNVPHLSLGDIPLYECKNSLEKNKSYESNSFLNNSATKFNGPYIHRIMRNDVLTADNLTNFSKFLNMDMSNSNAKKILNFQTTELAAAKSFIKECHRRHHSDPLPITLDSVDKSSCLPSPPTNRNNKKCNINYSSESKENSCLLLEIKSLKEMNNKLWEHLCSLQTSLEKFRKFPNETSDVISLSDLLSSIYDSLRSKEDAMEDRMKIILQERNKAIEDLDCMIQVLAKSFQDNSFCDEKISDKDLQELLNEIDTTCSPVKLLQQQRLLLSYLYRSKELRQDHLMHQLKLIAAEKDNLMIKVKLLEEELQLLKASNEIQNTDNKFWESSLLSALCQVIQQRDSVVKNYNSHNNMDFMNSRTLINESKSFDSDVISDCLQRLDGVSVKKKGFQSPQNESRKYSPLTLKSKSEEVKYLKEEILILNKSLEIETEKREKAEEKCVRLERLVNVLQKKINGQNVGIPV